MKGMKRWTLVFLVLALMGICAAALAYTNTTDLYNVKDFKFHHYKYGIGCGACPVYTAPSKDAYRVGRATCGTDDDMYVAGKDAAGWLLVRYETGNGGVRVGYIPPEYVRGFKFTHTNYVQYINESRIPCVADDDIPISDNPMSTHSSFGTIYRGETYYIMATYTYHGNWWYVETYINGQPARGFIDRNRVNPNPYSASQPVEQPQVPEVSPLNTRLLGFLTITADPTIVRRNADPGTDMVGRVHGYETYPYYEYKKGSTGSLWYYIYVFDQNCWGWVSGARCRVD